MELNKLSEGIIFEVDIQKKGYTVLLYRSPSQTHDEFDDFLLNLEQVLCHVIARNPLFVLLTDGFNDRAAKWLRF